MSETVRPGSTYQTLDEQRERLSPAEERFERARQTIGLFLGPVVFLVLYFIPLPLQPAQQALAAIFAFVIVYWLTEPIPIPVTAVLGIAACVLFGVASAEAVFGAFSSDTIFLFIGAFIIAQAMMTHGLDRRFAFRVLSIPGVSNSTYGVIIAFGAIAATISAFISNTATTAMLLPIGLGIMAALGGLVSEQAEGERDPSRLRFGTALMLMIAYGASVGGLITPIGSPPNLIGIGFIEDQTGTTISFFEWTITALPICLLMFLALCVILILLNRPEVRRISGADEYVNEERSKLGRISAGERNTMIAFGVAVTLWILPGIVNLIAGEDSAPASFMRSHLNEGVVAILAATLLFILPVNWSERRFTLTWNDAVRIDWGTILLFGAGITLGKLLSDTGLAKVIGNGITNSLGVTNLLAISALSAAVAVLISETTSNTASVGIVVPIVIPIAASAGVEPVIPALAAIFGASYGFMLPVSTPPNAIVYGSGMIPITKMVRSGIVFDIIGSVLIV
ncbi:MAG: DASS family sodium-coupled anion symporter, partial [Actinomycetota bacterium]|nr:DASS family sodium-coupled anion symporter [Actinomycetota bacterium]